MIVDLQHAGIVEFLHFMFSPLRSVPSRGIIRVFLIKFPQELDKAFHIRCWHGLSDNDITFSSPVFPILRRKDSEWEFFLYIL